MPTKRLSGVLAIALLIAVIASPVLATEHATAPTGRFERVVSVLQGLWSQVQASVCFVGCDPQRAVTVKTTGAQGPSAGTTAPAPGTLQDDPQMSPVNDPLG